MKETSFACGRNCKEFGNANVFWLEVDVHILYHTIFCDLYDVNNNFLSKGRIQNENLLVVNIQDLFNMPYINYKDGLEFQREEFNN